MTVRNPAPRGHQHLASDLLEDTLTTGDVLYVNASGDLALLPIGSTGNVLSITGGVPVWAAGGGGAIALADLTDVNTSTPTNKNFLVADGVDWESRSINSDDLTDVAVIAMLDEAETVTGAWTFSALATLTGGLDVDSAGTELLDLTHSGTVDFNLIKSGTGNLNITNSGTGSIVVTGTLDVSAATFSGLSSDDLSDVASIAMLDEAETVTGQWTFSSYMDVVRSGGLAKDMLHLRDSTDTQDWVIYYDGSWWEIRSEQSGTGTRWMYFGTGQQVAVDGNLDVGSGLDVTGNITVTGTVDGRDVATDGSKLDGIEAGATADQTAGEIEAIVNHDNLLGFVANEHIDWTAASSAFSTTGGATVTNGFAMGSVVAASTTDLSEHISLYGGTYGFNITASNLNLVASSTNTFSSTSTALTSKVNHDFSAGIDVTGNITVTGTVDGVDIAARDHDSVTLAGTPDYITLSGQVITRGLVDLSTDVTGSLPAASVASGNLGSGVLPYATASSTASAFTIPFMNTTGVASGNFAILIDSASPPTYNPSTGVLSATTFSGSGASLTALVAANISSGNLGSGVLPYATASSTASAFTIPFMNTTGVASGNFAILIDSATPPTYNPSTGTMTATAFSGSGASLTSIPETAITDGSILARIAAAENISGAWNFTAGLDVNTGSALRVYDGSNTDYIEITHDGVNPAIECDTLSTTINVGTASNLTSVTLAYAGSLRQNNTSAAPADTTNYGQWWNQNYTPNVARFTDETGIDYSLQNIHQWEMQYSSTTTAGDPGAGTVRFNSVTIGSITTMYIDDLLITGADNDWVLSNLANGDLLSIRSMSDPTKYIIAKVNGTPTDGVGYWTVPLTLVHTGVIFTNAELLMFSVDWLSQSPTGTGLSNVVEDTTPQLGGNLDTNNFNIVLTDSDKVAFGTSSDLTMMWDGIDFEIEGLAAGSSLMIRDAMHLYFWDEDNSHYAEFQHDGTDFALSISPAVDFSILNGANLALRAGGDLYIYDSDSSDYIRIYHSGTNAVVDNTIGVVQFLDSIDVTGNIAVSGTVDGIDLAAIPAANIATGSLANGVNQYFTASSTAAHHKIPFMNYTSTASTNASMLHDTETTFTYNPSTNEFSAPIVRMAERGTTAPTASATFGYLWVQTQTPNYLMFTDDASTTKYVGMGSYNLIANQTFDMNTAGNAEQCVNGAWYSDNATAYTLTLENSSGTDFPVGAQMTVWNEGSGTLTINEGTTTTLYLLTGSAATDTAGGCTMAQGGYATIIRKSTTVYLIMGAGLTA